jgi:copper homeostasis protein
MRVLLECVVETADAAAEAERAGANRLELCARLEVGGVTPPDDVVDAVVSRIAIPVFVMVRPRGGDFVYSAAEHAQMLADAARLRRRGAHGLVFGALRSDRRIDVDRTRAVVGAAGDLPVTFHRAFDEVEDQAAALEEIFDAGARRVLTSGGAASAIEGADRLAELVRQAGTRLTVLAGGGVRARNAVELIARTGAREVHARHESAAATRALAGLL